MSEGARVDGAGRVEVGFTPGPWVVRHEFNVMARRGKVSEGVVASCGGFSDNTGGGVHYYENIANARLIAAAPDLLAALESLADDHEFGATGTVRQDHLRSARAAIRKARGQQNDATTPESEEGR